MSINIYSSSDSEYSQEKQTMEPENKRIAKQLMSADPFLSAEDFSLHPPPDMKDFDAQMDE
jgi:hypothetical protein